MATENGTASIGPIKSQEQEKPDVLLLGVSYRGISTVQRLFGLSGRRKGDAESVI
jgi:hypothetical protein